MSACSRRELLAAFLGAPAALALSGCPASPAAALPPGDLVGASVSFGHRLRQADSLPVAEQDWRTARVAIVGAGVAGLSAARRLASGGVDDVVLLELEPAPGGTSRSGTTPVVPHPWGAHYVPAPTRDNPELVRLLAEVGALEGEDEQGQPQVAEPFGCRSPEERVFYKGFWQEGLYLRAGASPDDLRQLQRFQQEIQAWVAWRDGQGRRAFTIPMADCSDDAELSQLDRMSMAEWLRQRNYSSPRLWWLVDYACRDDFGMRCEQTSAWAGLFYFAARIPRPGADSRPFITWPEGNGRLVDHLFQPFRRRTLLGWAVADIRQPQPTERGPIEVRAISADGKGCLGYRVDQVIFAAPYFLAPYLIRSLRESAAGRAGADAAATSGSGPDSAAVPDAGQASPALLARAAAEFEYSAWAVVNLTLSRPPQGRGFPLAWDNVLYESPSLGYVATSYQRGLDHGPAVLTWYYPLCDDSPAEARRRLLDLGRDEWVEIALSDLQRPHPEIRRETLRADVMRWGHAMIRPRPGFIWGTARRQAERGLPRIHFAHSDLSGLGLFEEAFYRGTRAAERALEELERGQ